MLRHVAIATICIETALLLGGGVVIGQLWMRSDEAEASNRDLKTSVAQFEEQITEAQTAAKGEVKKRQELEQQLADIDRDRLLTSQDFTSLQKKFAQLEAQNVELEKAADKAVELSKKVAELQHELDTINVEADAGDQRRQVRIDNRRQRTPVACVHRVQR